MNFLSGYAFGRNDQEAIILALLGLAADGWKSIGPILIVGLYLHSRVLTMSLGALVWFACFAVAVTAAVGLIGETRTSIAAEREALHQKYEARSESLKDLEARRGVVEIQRSSEEIDAQINVLLAQPVVIDKRYRGTIDSVSKSCEAVTPKTAVTCAEIAGLKSAKARAIADNQLGREIDRLRDELQELTLQGAKAADDPQGDFIVFVTGNLLSRSEVPLALVLMFVVMLELLSAFAPVVLSEYSAVKDAPPSLSPMTKRSDSPRQGQSDCFDSGSSLIVEVFDYMADRIRPARTGRMLEKALWLDYRNWCVNKGTEPATEDVFTAALARICEVELQGEVRREGGHIVGCTFAVQSVTQLVAS